jgi:hypothetical protein
LAANAIRTKPLSPDRQPSDHAQELIEADKTA